MLNSSFLTLRHESVELRTFHSYCWKDVLNFQLPNFTPRVCRSYGIRFLLLEGTSEFTQLFNLTARRCSTTTYHTCRWKDVANTQLRYHTGVLSIGILFLSLGLRAVYPTTQLYLTNVLKPLHFDRIAALIFHVLDFLFKWNVFYLH